MGGGGLQTRKATKVDQVNPTLDPLTHSMGGEGEGGGGGGGGGGGWLQTRKATKGSSEPHPGPIDPFHGGGGVTDHESNQSGSGEPHPGGGGRYRPEKQPMWIK